MNRLLGIMKVLIGLAGDFTILFLLFDNFLIAFGVTAVIALYVFLGGYIALQRDGAISLAELPAYSAGRLELSKKQLISDVKAVSNINLSNLRLYLIPGDSEMNATAYGAGCVSVTQGTFNNADPITLTAVLGHEVSHLINFDSEFNRLVFASVTLLMVYISVLSVVAVVVVFLIFLIFNCFRSWFGVLAFKGTTKVTKGYFSLIQRGVVGIYRAVLGVVSRNAEYRCDRYSFCLGYGAQLAHFLSIADASDDRVMTLRDVIYRSHPPTAKRIARLEEQLCLQNQANI